MRGPDPHTLEIRTPENLAFPLILAGPAARFAAWLVDMCVIAAAASVAARALAALSWFGADLAAAVLTLAYFAVSVLYGMLMEWLAGGQTLGKRVLRIRVLDGRGLRLRPHQAVIRNLFRFLDMLPAGYLVGGTACLLSRRCQRLGDMAAGTLVVRAPDPGIPDPSRAAPGRFNSLLAFRHLGARLRQQVSPAEAALAMDALLRRDELEATHRARIFRELREHFDAKAHFPPEASEGLPDEQYVRNVVEILYRRGGAQGP